MDLLRHGETTGGGGFRGSLDDPLSEAGWAQMRASTPDAGRWEAVVSSPLQRCAAFAELFARSADVPLMLEPDLRELHFGEWEGRTAAELMHGQAEALAAFWSDPYGFTPPGAEPVAHFEARVCEAVERLQRRYAGSRVLVVSHAGVMRLLLARQRGLAPGRLLEVEVAHGSLHPFDPSCLARPRP